MYESVHSLSAELPKFGRGLYPVVLGLMASINATTNATITNTTTTITTADLLKTTMRDIDVLWVLVATMMVFLMQTGFSFLEAGSLRSSSVTNVLTKVCRR